MTVVTRILVVYCKCLIRTQLPPPALPDRARACASSLLSGEGSPQAASSALRIGSEVDLANIGLMTSQVPEVFSQLASNLRVPQDQVEVLAENGITTADELFFRLPTSEALEEYMREEVAGKFIEETTFNRDGQDVIERRVRNRRDGEQPVDVRSWMRSAAAASVRRLWEASKAAAKRDLARATDEADSRMPSKLNIAVVSDLMRRAEANGLRAFSEGERPGQSTLSKVSENFRSAGAWQYIDWENYVSEEDERLIRRSRGSASAKPIKITLEESQLSLVKDDPPCQRSIVTEVLALQDALHIRSVAHAWLNLLGYEEYQEWSQLLISSFRRRQPERMRGPMMGELRLVDRLVHEEILAHASRGTTTLARGFAWYIGDGRSSRILKLLDGQTEGTPDLSIENASKRPRVSDHADRSTQQAPPASPVCWVCGKLRKDHEGRRWCSEGQQSQQSVPWQRGQPTSEAASWKGRSKGKEKGKQSGKGKSKDKGKSKGRQGKQNTPEWMSGCAQRTPPSAQHPSGVPFCFAFHAPGGTCSGSCSMSHRCPRFKADGTVCMQAHALPQHTE